MVSLQQLKISKTEDEIILEPHTNQSQILDQKVRVILKLIDGFDFWLRIPKNKLKIIKDAHKIMDTSVMLDDLDSKPICSNTTNCSGYRNDSLAATLNAANFAGCIAVNKSFELDHPEAIGICVEQTLESYRGQAMEYDWRENLKCPTEDEYRRMCIRKTGSFYYNSVRLMQLFSDDKSNFVKITEILAQFFRIYEDYIDLTQNSSEYCKSFSLGKFNFAVVHAINKYPEDVQLMNLIKQKSTDKKIYKYMMSLLEQFGSLEHTKETLIILRNEAEEEMKKFEYNPFIIKFLDDALSKFNSV
ncbi:terpene synthase-like [Tenebrio molitor]|uniref:terpene synthase-like n=1 Tax=Tenebrio molitor TaxID=7067 RepID=UPI0036249CFB